MMRTQHEIWTERDLFRDAMESGNPTAQIVWDVLSYVLGESNNRPFNEYLAEDE